MVVDGRFQPNLTLRRPVLGGIPQQIRQNLPHATAVRPDRRQFRRQVDGQALLFARQQRRQILADTADEPGHIHHLPVQRNRPRFQPRAFQQIGDQRLQPRQIMCYRLYHLVPRRLRQIRPLRERRQQHF